MIAKYAIEESIPFLKQSDTISFGLELMEDFKQVHLPVVENNKLIGVVSEQQLLDAKNTDTIKDLPFPLINVYVNEHTHLFDVMKKGYESSSSVLPIVDVNENYIGLISPKSILNKLSEFNFVNEVGGIFVIEVEAIQYSLAEIARLVESNRAIILSVASAKIPNDINTLQVTIKVNTLDLTFILATLERYDYRVTHVFHQAEQISELKNRYDAFMHYLNM